MNRTVILLVLVAVAAGGAFGYVLGSGGDAPAAGSGPLAYAPAPPLPFPLPLIPDPPAGSPAITAAIESIPVVEPPRGTGVIRGRVVTEAGKPLGGVIVTAKLRNPPPAESKPYGQQTLEDKIRALVIREEYWRRSRRETVSAADGTFEITGLPDLKHLVRGSLEGYTIHWADAENLERGAEVELKAKPVGRLRLTVLLPDGSAPERAEIRYESMRMTSHRTWTPANPEVTFETGAWSLVVSSGEDEEYRSPPVKVLLREGEPTKDLVIRLALRTGIQGTVVPAPGETGTRAGIAILKLAEGAKPDSITLVNKALRHDRLLTFDRKGLTFRRYDLPPGRYAVGLVEEGKLLVSKTVEVVAGLAEVELRTPIVDRGATLLVKVFGPDGKAVPGAEAHAFAEVSGRRVGQSRFIGRTGEGEVRITHPEPPVDSPPPIWIVQVSSGAFGWKSVEYGGPSVREIVVRFDEPAGVVISVAGYVGSGHEGQIGVDLCEVREGQSPGFHPWQSRGNLGAEGRAVREPIAPGPYDLVLWVCVSDHTAVPIEVRRVELRSGRNELKLALPRLYPLTVLSDRKHGDLVLASGPGAQISWQGWPSDVVDGRVSWERLPAGRYRVGEPGASPEEMLVVTIPGTREIRYVEKRK